MGTQKNKILTDASQTHKEMEKMRKQLIKQREEIRKISSESRRMNKNIVSGTGAVKKGFQNSVQAGLGLIKTYVGVQAAATAVNKVLQDQQRIQAEGKALSTSIARSQASVVKNIGPVSKNELQSFLAEVQKIERQTKFGDEAQLNLAASSLLSGTGGDQKKTLDLLRETAPFFKDAPQQLAAFAGAVADVQKATGGSAKNALSLVLGIQGQARIDKLEALKNFAPAAAASRISTQGADSQQQTKIAGALFAAIGSQIGDVEGNVTASAVIGLQKKLEETFPELDSFQDKLKAIRSASEDERNKFIASGFEKKTVGAIRELIFDQKSQTSQNFVDAMSKIKASPAKVDQMKQLLRDGTQELEFFNVGSSAKSAKDQFLKDTGAGVLAEAREITVDALANTRAKNLFSSSLNFLAEGMDINFLSGSTTDQQINSFIQKLNERELQVRNRFGTFGKVDEKRRAQEIEYLRQAVVELKKLRQLNGNNRDRSQDEGQ